MVQGNVEESNLAIHPTTKDIKMEIASNDPNQPQQKKRRINGGISTNDLIFSSYNTTNDDVFPNILKLYVAPHTKVADSTYGKGVFWKQVDCSNYELFFSDLKINGVPNNVKGGVDARRLPYDDSFLDALVFDPPYMHTPGGTAHINHQNFETYYANNVTQLDKNNSSDDRPKYHEAVLALYFSAAKEALRVLKFEGIYIVKCQDEVCSNKQRLTHVELINEFEKYGFVTEDLFVIMRRDKPGVSRIKAQKHARKNHSYFLIFKKPKVKKIRKS